MLATQRRPKFVFDVSRFLDIRNQVADVYIHDGDAIRAKAVLRTHASIFAKLAWLVSEIERLGGGPLEESDRTRYDKTKRFAKRVNEDYEEAIKGGYIVKTSSEVFGAMRFLVRCLEAIVKFEDPELLEGSKPLAMPPEKVGHIVIDLEAGIEDTPEETAQALAEVQGEGDEGDGDLP